MEENMFRKFFTTTTILILLFAAVASAQTGKIIGKIVDKETGQPLIGANVLVVGTNFGAATDVNGDYVIANISPGTYSVRASYVSYQNVTIENIRISTNLSTTVDFQLPTTTLATNEVVIVSERPLIQKSATNAIRIVNAEDLEDLPVRSINSVIGLQAGVVQQNGVTFVRGSRGDETGYVVEGASVKNIVSRNGGNLVTIIPDAVQEISVQAGGTSAEYGGANAGVVSEDFKSGTNDYHFSLRAETDNFGNFPGDKFLGTYSYGYYDYTATISGPVIGDKFKIFLAGENSFNRENSPFFFYDNPSQYSDGALWDTTKVYDTGGRGGSTADYQVLDWTPGNIPGNSNNLYALNGTATLDLNPLIVRLSGSYDYSRSRNNSNDVVNLFATDRLGLTDRSGLLLNLKATYLLENSSYIEASVSMLDRRTEAYDPVLKENFLTYDDSLIAASHGWQYRSFTTGPANYDFYGFPFSRPGTRLSGYGKSHWSNFGANVAFTTQLDKHEIKAGASYQRWSIRNYGVGGSSTLLNDLRNNPDIARNPSVMNVYMSANQFRLFGNYGFDFYGREIDNEFGEQFAPKHPVFTSAYVQDKIEIKDIIINAGYVLII
jgi:hypothetical protein